MTFLIGYKNVSKLPIKGFLFIKIFLTRESSGLGMIWRYREVFSVNPQTLSTRLITLMANLIMEYLLIAIGLKKGG